MPRYEYTEGTSNKFWEIEQSGTSYTAKWGRIGGSVSMSTKDFADAASAKKQVDKLIAEKVKKGYLLVGGGSKAKPDTSAKAAKTTKAAKVAKAPAAPSGPARNAALEKAILANPDDADAYLVYADWMQSNGEIRGELAVLQHAGKTKEANALIRKFGDWFLGDFAKRKPETFELEWFCGYIKSASIGWPDFEHSIDEDEEGGDEDEVEGKEYFRDWENRCHKQLAAFLRHPSAQFIQKLELGCVPGDDHMSSRALTEAIDEVKPPCLRELSYQTGDWDISSTTVRMPACKSIKGIRVLHLSGGEIWIDKKLELPELREFTVRTGGLDKDSLKSIANAKWPKIEKLRIYCGDPNYGASGGVKQLAPLFAATGVPTLTYLGIMNCPFADEAVKALITSKILPKLKTLDLSMGNLSDKGIDTMVAAKAAFAHLELLDLDDNALTDVSKSKIKGLAKKVKWGRQDSPERAVPRAEEDRWDRYVALGE